MTMELPEYKAEKFDGNENLPKVYIVSFVNGHSNSAQARGVGLNFSGTDLEAALHYYDHHIQQCEEGGGTKESYLNSYIWFGFTLTEYDPSNNGIKVLKTYMKVRSSKRTIIKPQPKTTIKKLNLDDYLNSPISPTPIDISNLFTTTTNGQNEL